MGESRPTIGIKRGLKNGLIYLSELEKKKTGFDNIKPGTVCSRKLEEAGVPSLTDEELTKKLASLKKELIAR